MRVFITGGAGFIGSAVVSELIANGHKVTGLARSEANETSLKSAGADIHRGSIDNLDSLRSGAAAADGVIHCAFNHDFSQFAANAEEDRRALEVMAETLAGSNRPLISTSGLLGVAPGALATENDPANAMSPRRSESVLDAAARGVRAMTIRLPPNTHEGANGGFAPYVIAAARQHGVSAYVGDGRNRWPAAHRRDAASLYRLALEKGVAGARYHALGDEGIAFRDLADVIGKRLNLPVASKTAEEAPAHFGFLGGFAGLDAPASAALTREQLGWKPTHPGLIADLESDPSLRP
ncbi:MAG: SDR family oxidoreductase [Alphaproteobacteria bacterium]